MKPEAKSVGELFGARLKQLRRSRGWRQIDLARHAEMNRNHLSDIERGKADIQLTTMARLAKALGKDLGELTAHLHF